MRVLGISPYPVLPLTHGGRVRAYRLAVGLARAGAVVDIACPWVPGVPRRPFERDGITIRPFVFAANTLPLLLGDWLMPPLFQLSLQPLTRGPRRLLRRLRLYDVVEFHFCAYASWMRLVAPGTRVVYSAHNVEWDFATSEPRSRLRHAFDGQIARLERHAVAASDVVVTCTEADAKRLRELYGEPKSLAVVPNGFDEAALWGPSRPSREKARAALGLAPNELAILFVGGPAAHNRRAARFLEHQLLPALDRPARLVIVGECGRPRRQGRVLALGFVDDLSQVVAAVDVAVNPVEAGSGSNVKVAEYLAAGLPIVSTRIGMRGFETFADAVTIAELDSFAQALRAHGLVETLRADRRFTTRRLELASLSWTALGHRLHDVYEGLLSEPAPTAPLREPVGVLAP